MIVIVDAYNVLKYSKGSVEVGHADIEAFLHDVRSRARAKKYRLIVVFDGGSSSYPTRDDRHDIEVIYAGKGHSADALIEELCKKYRGHEVVIISADRMLCRTAADWGALCIAPAVYLQRIHERPIQKHVQTAPMVVKHAQADSKHVSPEEFHAMMEASALHARVKAADVEDQMTMRARAGQHKARSVKLLERVIEKL